MRHTPHQVLWRMRNARRGLANHLCMITSSSFVQGYGTPLAGEAYMSKSSRSRRTQRQKLLDTVADARAGLLDSARDRHASTVERAMYPSAAMAELFRRYSNALRSLVGHHLAAPEWELAEDAGESTWRWDGYDAHFSFDYAGFADLPRSDEEVGNLRAPRIRCSVHLTFDPALPLDDELARLATEAKHYRDSVALMEREVYRLVVRAEAGSSTRNAPSRT